MKFSIAVCFILITISAFAQSDSSFPETTISNGVLSVRLHLPDPVNGSYRAVRFDWSGNIYSLKYKGNEYFGQWYATHDPAIHDAIAGPVDDFIPAGFSEARPGGTFLKIGVGVLVKPDDNPYSIARTYAMSNPGVWQTKRKSTRIQFTHDLKDEKFSYRYIKTIQLLRGKPVMLITHSFRNLGENIIETPGYNHNFFVINNQPVGPGYCAIFPYEITGNFQTHPELVDIENNSFSPKRILVPGEFIQSRNLRKEENIPGGYEFRIENKTTGAGVKVSCETPLQRMAFWANPATFCPEPFILVKAAPGEEFMWTIRYEFYEK